MSSVVFAINIEVRPLPILIIGLAIAIFLRFKYYLLGLLSLGIITLLPGYLSLRAGFALLAVSLYIQSFRKPRYRKIYLLLTGILTGVTFTFGQDTAVMVLATVAITEVCLFKKDNLRKTSKEAGTFIIGLLLGLLPLLVYIMTLSDIKNFLYYTLYYAFILQPKGMDVPYPDFRYDNLIYFIVPILLTICFYVLYSTKRMRLASAILLAFVVARLVTLFGRTDIAHLFFTLPEIIFIALFSLYQVRYAELNKQSLYKFIPFGVLFIIALIGAIYFITSIWIIVAMLVVMVAYKLRTEPMTARGWQNNNVIVLSLLTTFIAITGYIIYPYCEATITNMSKRGITTQSIDGQNAQKADFDFVNNVKETVGSYRPNTLFSYPIQPYYYALAPKHATRFMTYEPQTTLEEQDQTIEDLKRTRPEVVIFDPAQAAGLSKSLWKINKYITTYYEIAKTITGKRVLWVMTPKQQSGIEEKLVFSVYKSNDIKLGYVRDIQSPEKGIVNGLQVSAKSKAIFNNDGDINSLRFSVYNDQTANTATCGNIKQVEDGKTRHSIEVCIDDGDTSVDVLPGVDEIHLENTDFKSIIFNEARLLKKS